MSVQGLASPAVLHLGTQPSPFILPTSNTGSSQTAATPSPYLPSSASSFAPPSAGSNLPSAFSQLIQTLVTLLQGFLQQLQSLMGGSSNSQGSTGNGSTQNPTSNNPQTVALSATPPISGDGQAPPQGGSQPGSTGNTGSMGGSSGSAGPGSTTGTLFNAGKEGLGINGTSANGDGSNLSSTKASWYYNWSPNASSNVNDPNATFIPMIWGQGNMNSQDLKAAADSSSPMILTFNEPEISGQGNMTPQQALGDWSQLEATGKNLSSPAITNDGDNGINWLNQFMTGASAAGDHVDSIALHWYGSSSQTTAQNLANMKDFIDKVHSQYPNLPIDLTEFGVDPNGNSAGKDQDFLTQAEQMLNGMSYVQMYAPYGLGASNGN